jgi:CheY-like chemotaxis protein
MKYYNNSQGSPPSATSPFDVVVLDYKMPDVVVLDYKMPGKDGMEVAKEILTINPDQRIIFASANFIQPQQAMLLLRQLHQLMSLLEQQIGQVLPERRQQMIQLLQRQFHQGMGLLTPRQRQHLKQILTPQLQQILLSVS